jgi:sulfite exporter TauE/SafE
MTPLTAVIDSFLFGLLHGILPDEHTWPITFSYAIGGGSGKEGMKAGLFFSAAFTLQRTIVSELAYLALAPFLLRPTVNGIAYVVVGIVMFAAGTIVLRRNRYPHFHLLGHHHDAAKEIERTIHVLGRQHAEETVLATAPPVHWTIIHGFVAGFGFGGFSLFVNTVAAPAMPSPWVGFLPGLVFGLGTMIMLAILGGVFGASLRWMSKATEQDIRRIGALTGGRALFFGGILFAVAGLATLMGLDRYSPVDPGYALIAVFIVAVAAPSFLYSLRGIQAARKLSQSNKGEENHEDS